MTLVGPRLWRACSEILGLRGTRIYQSSAVTIDSTFVCKLLQLHHYMIKPSGRCLRWCSSWALEELCIEANGRKVEMMMLGELSSKCSILGNRRWTAVNFFRTADLRQLQPHNMCSRPSLSFVKNYSLRQKKKDQPIVSVRLIYQCRIRIHSSYGSFRTPCHLLDGSEFHVRRFF